ncbi:MAG: hypothetical protein OXG80_01975, partial [Chloroflexi bacterium]|nr:hypothetical protein [Chloroflexota bacterium]
VLPTAPVLAEPLHPLSPPPTAACIGAAVGTAVGAGAGSTRVIGVTVVRGGGGTRSSLQASTGSASTATTATISAAGGGSLEGSCLVIVWRIM